MTRVDLVLNMSSPIEAQIPTARFCNPAMSKLCELCHHVCVLRTTHDLDHACYPRKP